VHRYHFLANSNQGFGDLVTKFLPQPHASWVHCGSEMHHKRTARPGAIDIGKHVKVAPLRMDFRRIGFKTGISVR